ncbi:MAG: glycosyltransferase [Ktedonobacterales bacterium]
MIDAGNPDYKNTPASNARPYYDYTPRDHGTPFVSIITPYYNIGDVFSETVRCIQRMSYQHFEWIIVDDGTTDSESLAQLAALAASDSRVQVIHQTNQGPSAARNHAAKVARGRYLLQLDADDLVEPTFVEKALWLMETQPQFAACSSFNVTFGIRSLMWNNGFQEYKNNLTKENFVTNQAMIRRDAYLQAGGYDESIVHGHEDWDFWLNLAEAGFWGYTIPEHLTWYRTWHHSRIRETSGDRGSSTAFRSWLLQKHDRLRKRFPHPTFISGIDQPHPLISDRIPISNHLVKVPGTKRILFVVPWLRIGGADKFNLDVVRTLSGRGYEFTMVTTIPSHHDWLHQFAEFTPDIFHLPNFLQYADYPRFLNYLIDSRQIDAVLISNSELGYCLVPFLRAYHPKLPILDYTHSEVENWKNGGYPWMSVRLGSQLDLSITCTEHLRGWMVGRGANADHITVVHANIDSDEWDPARYDKTAIRQRLGIDDDTVIVLYVGRIAEEKRPLMWTEILRQLAQTDKNFVGLVVGDGDLLYAMKSFVKRHGLQQRIRFLGALPNEEVREIMTSADVLLLPSKIEGLAIVLYEAMAMGTVPVATSFGGHSELVSPECGYLIPPSDNEIGEYLEAMRRLVRHSQQRSLMAVAGRERVRQHFTLDNMAEGMEQAFCLATKVAADRSTAETNLVLAQHSASLAIEYMRLSELSDKLWYELYIKAKLPRVRSVADMARFVRIITLPIGTRRYELYKSVRRALFPSQQYSDEFQGLASSNDGSITPDTLLPEGEPSARIELYVDGGTEQELESIYSLSDISIEGAVVEDDLQSPSVDLMTE